MEKDDKYKHQRKYMSEKLKNFGFREKPEILEAFKKKCEELGTHPTTEIRAFIRDFLDKHQ